MESGGRASPVTAAITFRPCLETTHNQQARSGHQHDPSPETTASRLGERVRRIRQGMEGVDAGGQRAAGHALEQRLQLRDLGLHHDGAGGDVAHALGGMTPT